MCSEFLVLGLGFWMLIIPSNVADIAGLVASAMTVLDKTKQLGASK
jgi:hypothetical protein